MVDKQSTQKPNIVKPTMTALKLPSSEMSFSLNGDDPKIEEKKGPSMLVSNDRLVRALRQFNKIREDLGNLTFSKYVSVYYGIPEDVADKWYEATLNHQLPDPFESVFGG